MRVFSGMQPSGGAHLGNYFGSMKPNIDLLDEGGEHYYMIADQHALTSIHNPNELRDFRQGLTMDMLACGFDPSKGILFFQSYVPEHTELAWILSCVTPMGFLERAVSFKEKTEKGLDASVGLFTYPVLQACDIVLYDADIVPVGKDQKQHIEMARDMAQKLNKRYGSDILKLPEPHIREDVAVVPGIDGQKMSKSYGNTIPLFADEKIVKKAIMSIVTDSKDVDDPKDPDDCIVYKIHALFLDEDAKNKLAESYRAGGIGYSDAKKMLFEAFMDYFGPMRARHRALRGNDAEAVIMEGSNNAKRTAAQTMERVRKAVGLR
jgi:tryptophanyl-tRNA synthetase